MAIQDLAKEGLRSRLKRMPGSAQNLDVELQDVIATEATSPFIDTFAADETPMEPTSSMSFAPATSPNGAEITSWNITPVEFLDLGLESEPLRLSGLPLDLQRVILRDAASNGWHTGQVVGQICHTVVDPEDPRMMSTVKEVLEFYYTNYGGGL
jgi:hypothetical protein